MLISQRIRFLVTLFVIGPAFLTPSTALATEAAKLSPGNTAWVLTSTALVLFMTIPGLSLFYGGLVRSKNILSVLMQCFFITCLVSLLWLVMGYSLAFENGGFLNAVVGSLKKSFFSGVTTASLTGDIPETVFAMFQLTFAIITPALIVGGFAERVKFNALALFIAFWAIFVYAPVCHWVWGGGWLGTLGALDFAGGTVVHITAGVAALVCTLVMGTRKGFPETAMTPHNMTMCVTGAGMLWVGWFGFNAGSALAANGSAGMAMLVTHISAAAASLAWMSVEWVRYGKPSVLGIVTGMVAGLVAITPAAGFVGPAGALVLGLAAGFICFTATTFMKQRLRVDDSLDVFPVHGVGGMLGALLTGVFASANLGIFSGGGYAKGVTMAQQVGIQIVGIVATVVYTAVVTFIIVKVVSALAGGLRVSENEEVEGLDINLHNEHGYEF